MLSTLLCVVALLCSLVYGQNYTTQRISPYIPIRKVSSVYNVYGIYYIWDSESYSITTMAKKVNTRNATTSILRLPSWQNNYSPSRLIHTAQRDSVIAFAEDTSTYALLTLSSIPPFYSYISIPLQYTSMASCTNTPETPIVAYKVQSDGAYHWKYSYDQVSWKSMASLNNETSFKSNLWLCDSGFVYLFREVEIVGGNSLAAYQMKVPLSYNATNGTWTWKPGDLPACGIQVPGEVTLSPVEGGILLGNEQCVSLYDTTMWGVTDIIYGSSAGYRGLKTQCIQDAANPKVDYCITYPSHDTSNFAWLLAFGVGPDPVVNITTVSGLPLQYRPTNPTVVAQGQTFWYFDGYANIIGMQNLSNMVSAITTKNVTNWVNVDNAVNGDLKVLCYLSDDLQSEITAVTPNRVFTYNSSVSVWSQQFLVHDLQWIKPLLHGWLVQDGSTYPRQLYYTLDFATYENFTLFLGNNIAGEYGAAIVLTDLGWWACFTYYNIRGVSFQIKFAVHYQILASAPTVFTFNVSRTLSPNVRLYPGSTIDEIMFEFSDVGPFHAGNKRAYQFYLVNRLKATHLDTLSGYNVTSIASSGTLTLAVACDQNRQNCGLHQINSYGQVVPFGGGTQLPHIISGMHDNRNIGFNWYTNSFYFAASNNNINNGNFTLTWVTVEDGSNITSIKNVGIPKDILTDPSIYDLWVAADLELQTFYMGAQYYSQLHDISPWFIYRFVERKA